LVTPTSKRLAPMAHNMDVALGASETIRKLVPQLVFMLCRMRIAEGPSF
jgi:hypothetical protein